MDEEELLRSAYRAFNGRNIEAAIALMHEEVDWPNAWEGGRVVGHAAVRDYWTRQFESISSKVEPRAFEHLGNGEVVVSVDQTVYDARSGEKLSQGSVRHRYRVEGDLILRMDVMEGEPEPDAV